MFIDLKMHPDEVKYINKYKNLILISKKLADCFSI